MRILHFLPVYVPAWQYGGPVLSVSRLCEGLVQQGLDVHVITTNAGLPDFPVDQLGIPQNVNGVTVFYYAVDRNDGVISSQQLVNSLSDHMAWAEVAHLSSIWQPLGLHVQKAAHAAQVPVIQTLRGALGPYSWRRGWWKKIPYFILNERPLLQLATALHCTTLQEASEINWLGLKSPVQFLPNPIDFSQLKYNPDLGRHWRESNAIPASEPLFLVVGRLHHKKGLDLLPNVLRRIVHRPWQIVFLGQDEDGTGRRLKRRLRDAGLSQRCHWVDHMPVDELSGPYNAADVLLLPSRHENFGNVVIEALACGCAVVISDRVGVSKSIRFCPGVTILPRSTYRWIEALQSLLGSNRPDQLSSEWVLKTYSQSMVANQALRIYKSIVHYV